MKTLEELKAWRKYLAAKAASWSCPSNENSEAVKATRKECEALGLDILELDTSCTCIMNLDKRIAAIEAR